MQPEYDFDQLKLPPTGSLINGTWHESGKTFEVLDKYTSKPFAYIHSATKEQVAQAVSIARKAMDERLCGAPHDRANVLRKAADLLSERKDELLPIMVAEAGFTLNDASGEIDRACITLRLSADEAVRLVGHMVPFAASPGAHKRLGYTQVFPIGVVCAITPFNSPLNTVLHKLAPAYAGGNAIVLKPSALTPLTSAFLGSLLLEAGIEPAYLSIVQGDGESVGSWLLDEPDIAFYTFTGSTRVGRIIQQAAGLRRTQMELGSIASTIICADADIDKAVQRVANAGWRKAGQVCTSVQRLYVESSCFDQVLSKLTEASKNMKVGNPRQADTFVGPMISEAAAIRAEKWINQAVDSGARLVAGGKRFGSVIEPTILTEVEEGQKVWCSEAFAPLIVVQPFNNFDEVLVSANSTPYGLSAGVFTNDLDKAFKAAQTLRFGTVMINESSSARSDVMPFGGVKDSGFGKEGPSYAIREMTEERLVIFNP